MKSTDEILTAIDEAVDDWEVGPDAVRYNAPEEAREQAEAAAAFAALLLELREAYVASYDQRVDDYVLGPGRGLDVAAMFVDELRDLAPLPTPQPEPEVSLLPGPGTCHPRWGSIAPGVREVIDDPGRDQLVVVDDEAIAARARYYPETTEPVESLEVLPVIVFQRRLLRSGDSVWHAYFAPDGSHIAGPARRAAP